jgi:RNA-directed DNA polymerase
MPGTPRPDPVSTKRQRIAELARNGPDMAFTNLAHHIDIEWMLTAHAQTRKDGAVGVDGQTADEYEVNLESNLQDLLDRAKSGTYVAPPVRRVHIPKAGSATETRPLGIPTYEDKILQRAVLMVLEPVYETDFLGSSGTTMRKFAADVSCCTLMSWQINQQGQTSPHGLQGSLV